MRLARSQHRPVAEAMEERILHSADFTPLSGMGAGFASGVVDARLHEAAASTTDLASVQRREIVFVDAGVPDAASIVADLQAQRAAGRSIEIVGIAAGDDGIAVIGATLAQRTDIAAVHLIAHGADGRLQLGSATLDATALMLRAGQVAGWGQALSADADLLLYGCDVAQTAAGERFVQDLAALTGADVAASDDPTGAVALGGDWALEYRAGQVQSASVASALEQARWQGVLATYTVTTGADQIGPVKLVGSLRWAIDQANTNPGVDEIKFVGSNTYNMLAGTTGDDLNDSGDFDVYEAVKIVGNGALNTVINGNGVDRVFDFHGTNIDGSNQFVFASNGYDVNVSGLTIQNGGGVTDGGGFRTDYPTNMTLSSSIVQGNAANSGAGISSGGTLLLSEVTVQGNVATLDGGGIDVFNGSDLYVLDSRLTGNRASAGGALHVQGGLAYVEMINSTIDANTATYGGGVYAQNGTVRVTTSTLSGNTATALGGGIYAGPATFNVRSSTIAFNTAVSGGGVYAATTPPIFHNSLITSSTGGDSNVVLGSSGYNIANDPGVFAGATDMRDSVGTIKLMALAQNGGYAPTHALPGNSSAVDAGDPAITYTDQREVARDGAAPDVGAFEYAGTTNVAPGINRPGPMSVFEDVSTAVGGVSVYDPNNGAGVAAYELSSVMLSVSPANGFISVGGPATISAGANNSASFTLSGTQAAINTSLATLRYQGVANYNGSDTLVITARDGAGGTRTQNVALSVIPVNDAPRGTDATLSVAPNTSRSLGRSDFGYGDAPGEGHAFVAVVVGPPSAGTLTLRGSVVAAPVEVAVGQLDAGELVFQPGNGASGSAYATLGFQVRDNGGTADGGVDLDPVLRVLSIDIVGIAPVITSDGGGQLASVGVAENSTRATTVMAGSAAPGGLTHTVAGGADAARFAFADASSGVLQFVAAPNFEAPADADADNVYDVWVRVTDSGGGVDTQRLAVTVTDVNEAPRVANALADRAATQETAIGFIADAGHFADPDAGDTLVYQARRLDGSALPGWIGFDTATSRFSGTPLDADVGAIDIRLTATDRAGASTFDDFTLTVANANDAPVAATPIPAQRADGDAAFSFTLPTNAFTDADLDNGDVLRYAAVELGAAGLPGWLAFDPTTGVFSGTPPDAQSGTITLRVTATDLAGASATGDFDLEVVDSNDAPTRATPLADQAARQGDAFRFTVPANAFDDSDRGDVLRYEARLVSGAALPTWLALNGATGEFSGTPADADVGTLDLRVTAIDRAGTRATSDFALAVLNANDAPVAARPLADLSATQDAAFAFVVPASAFADDDLDSGDSLVYGATRASGAALPVWLTFDPATGRFSGTPVDADVGRLDLLVTATDRAGETARSGFTLTVANINDAPVAAAPIPALRAAQGEPFDFTPAAAAFDDPDLDNGDRLGYSVTRADGRALPAWLSLDAATGRLTGAPADVDVGTVVLRITVTDLAGATASRDVALTVTDVNDAPTTGAAIANARATQGASFGLRVPGNAFADVDVDAGRGDRLGFDAALADGRALPAWLAFDRATGVFTGTPADADVGSALIRVSAIDRAGASASSDFVLSVANVNDDPERAVPIAAPAATQDAAFRFGIPAAAFTDADLDSGDRLALRATLADGRALPAWLAFDAATGTLTGTPADADVGALAIRIVATDLSGRQASSDFVLGVANANDAPVLALPLDDQTFTQGAVFGFALPPGAFTDLDTDHGDVLRYSATLAGGAPLPAWLRVDAASGRITGAPGPGDAGALQLRVIATDTAGAVAHADLALNVLPRLEVGSAKVETAASPTSVPAAAAPALVAPPGAATDAAAALPAARGARTEVARAVVDVAVADATPEPVRAQPGDAGTGVRHAGRAGIDFSLHFGDTAAPAATDAAPAAVSRLVASDDMRQRFDELRRQTAEGSHGAQGGRTVVGSTLAMSSGLSVGYVVWLVRGGVLASSMLSALPAWQMIDPLPVVTASRNKKKGEHDDETADVPEVERLFKKGSRDAPATPVVEAGRRARPKADAAPRGVRAALGAKP